MSKKHTVEKRFITHLRMEYGLGTLPDGYLRILFFYTRIDGEENEWYWGTDNNSFGKEWIDARTREGKLLALPKEVELSPNKSLWLDNRGNVYYANSEKPNGDPEKYHVFSNQTLIELCK